MDFSITPPIAALIVAGCMVATFSLAWVWAIRIENYSVVDSIWAFGIGVSACFFLATGTGGIITRLLTAVLVVFWSLRLGSYLHRRIRRMHPEEDARYTKLREVWNGYEKSAFFGFFQMQAASVFLLALPFLAIAHSSDGFGIVGITGAALTIIGLMGESLADRQMATFKRSNPDPKAVCRNGLWKYSRHPNYFFESVIWWGFYVIACGAPWGWLTIHSPLAITWLLLRVTGIPVTEASALARKGDAYREYQATTSPFIPLPPKHRIGH